MSALLLTTKRANAMFLTMTLDFVPGLTIGQAAAVVQTTAPEDVPARTTALASVVL